MPLSEFYQASIRGKIDSAQTKVSNCSSGLSFVPDNEFVELLWENGQIVMQGKSSRPRKNSISATTFSLPEDRVHGKDGAPISATKISQIENMNSFVGELSPSDPSSNVRMSAQFDNMVPWVNYPMEDPSPSDYCSDFFSEFPGVVMPAQGNNPVNQNIKHSNVGHGTVPKAIKDESDPNRITTMSRSSNAYQSSFVNGTARIEDLGTRGGCNAQQGISGNLLGTRSRKQDLASSKLQQVGISTDSVKFSHMSRPGALTKVNLQRIDWLKSNEDSSATASSNHIESSVIESSCGLQSTSKIQGQISSASTMSELRSSAKKSNDLVSIRRSEAVYEDMPRKNTNIDAIDVTKVNLRPPDQNNHHSLDLAAGVSLGRLGIEKDNEAIVASSVCSGNTTGATSDDTKRSTKRKIQEGEESGNHIEDLEDASVGTKKPISVKSTSAKRTRAAEVHNLSERRRRDRINEKMRALQELIPNCSKVDKASMLDEAIEYLKSLQLQVQMMSMGSGLCVPPMMLPNGMQHMRVPPLVHLPRMGVGMGMDMRFGYGMGMLDMNGSPGCSLIPTPPMQGTRFPCPAVPGQQGLFGMPRPANLPMFGLPAPGVPMSVPHMPQFNFMPGHSANSNSIPEASIANTNSLKAPSAAPSSSCKGQQEKSLNMDLFQPTNVNDSQGTKESSQQCTNNQTSSGSEDETDN